MIGENIAKFRERKKWTQRELAKRAGMSYSVISRIEAGERPVRDLELNLFADLLEVTADQILGRKTAVQNINADLSEEDLKMLAILRDPKNEIFFKEMASSEEEKLEQLRKIWAVIKDDLK